MDKHLKHYAKGNSPAVQGLGLRPVTAVGPGSIPGGGTKTLQAAQGVAKKKYTHTHTHKIKEAQQKTILYDSIYTKDLE